MSGRRGALLLRHRAEALAARLLCESPATEALGMACGHCSACVWLASGNHPDFRLVQPEEANDEEEGVSPRPAARAASSEPKKIVSAR